MAALPVEDEFVALARRLEGHHELFSMLWEIGAPVFTESIDTAAITFNSVGKPLRFLFNPTFWRSLPDYDRQFVICHEMLHAVLNHGFRGKDMLIPRYMNIAADLAVNHLLVDRFGFVRELLKDWVSICWVDTVFTNRGDLQLPLTNLTMEEYYELLFDRAFQEAALVDEHLFSPGTAGLRNIRAAAEMDALLSELDPRATTDVRKKLGKEGQRLAMRGTEMVSAWCAIESQPAPPVPWESIVRKRLRPLLEESHAEGWILENRRFPSNDGLTAPGITIRPVIKSNKRRQRCVFFLDTSGSVYHLRHRFFALVKSLPSDQYDIDACSFDLQVFPLNLKRAEVFGGGGTSFEILESWIQANRRRKGRTRPAPYPDVVFVVTDGYGDAVRPEHPKRWHWLMTTDQVSLVPKESARYFLKNYC